MTFIIWSRPALESSMNQWHQWQWYRESFLQGLLPSYLNGLYFSLLNDDTSPQPDLHALLLWTNLNFSLALLNLRLVLFCVWTFSPFVFFRWRWNQPPLSSENGRFLRHVLWKHGSAVAGYGAFVYIGAKQGSQQMLELTDSRNQYCPLVGYEENIPTHEPRGNYRITIILVLF